MEKYKGFLVDDDLNIYSERTNRKLKPYMGSDGYFQVAYRDENQKTIHERLHVILANCFIENPNHYKYINHIDQNKANNDLSNLEWCTNSENVKQYWDKAPIRRQHRTEIVVKDKNGYFKKYPSIRKLSEDLNIDRHKVARIIKGEIRNRYDYDFFECETTIERVSNM